MRDVGGGVGLGLHFGARRIYAICFTPSSACACARTQQDNRWPHRHALAAYALKCAQPGAPPGTYPPAPDILAHT
jgi:hypothetical protein